MPSFQPIARSDEPRAQASAETHLLGTDSGIYVPDATFYERRAGEQASKCTCYYHMMANQLRIAESGLVYMIYWPNFACMRDSQLN
jgi:predicted metalloendopeptidase